jgi:hypothetical protein
MTQGMSEPLRYPLWQEPLRDAILEFDTQRLSVKVHRAEQAICDRLHELTPETLDFHEQEALKDALATLEILKRQEQR